MARILKDIPIIERQVICSQCGRTVAYVRNDIQSYHGIDISGGPDGQEWIICPDDGCGKKIILRSW